MIARFDLYDFVSNLVPGLVFLWSVQMLAGLFGWTLPLDFTGELAETSILIALGYITGLLLQGPSRELVEAFILKPLWGGFPSERWLLPDDKHFSEAYKTRLLTLIRERFGVSTDPELPADCSDDRVRALRLKKSGELFNLVYHAVADTSPRPLILNAHYGLFRVLLTMFAVLALLSLVGLAWAWCCRPIVVLPLALCSVVFLASTFIAYGRCKKRGEDFAKSVYDLFMTGAGGKATPDKPA